MTVVVAEELVAGTPAPEPYDFRRPAAIPRERMRSLESAFDTFGDRWSTTLSARLHAEVVVDTVSVKEAKTASLRETLGKLGWTKALIIAGPEVDTNFGLAARNIPHIDVLPNAGLNVYDILRADKLVLTKAAIEAIEARFSDKEAA